MTPSRQAAAGLRDRVEAARLPPAGPELFIALDIDGTLVRRDGALSSRVCDAVRKHMEAGTHLSLATGRGIPGAREVLDAAGMREGAAVCSNGAITLDVERDAVLDSHTFDPSAGLAALHSLMPEALYAVESIGRPRRVTADFPPGELSGPSVVLPVEALPVPDATRMIVRGLDEDPDEFLRVVRGAGLDGVEYYIGWTAWVDVAPEGTSKAAALEGVRRRLDVDPRATVAVGDGGNDVEMLGWAGLGVAMGGAPNRSPRRPTLRPAPWRRTAWPPSSISCWADWTELELSRPRRFLSACPRPLPRAGSPAWTRANRPSRSDRDRASPWRDAREPGPNSPGSERARRGCPSRIARLPPDRDPSPTSHHVHLAERRTPSSDRCVKMSG